MLTQWQGGSQYHGKPTISSFPSPRVILVNTFLFFGVVATTVCAIPTSISTPVLFHAHGIPTAATATVDTSGRRVPKQVGLAPGATVGSSADHQQSGTHHHSHDGGFMDHHHGYSGGHHGQHGDGKYFM